MFSALERKKKKTKQKRKKINCDCTTLGLRIRVISVWHWEARFVEVELGKKASQNPGLWFSEPRARILFWVECFFGDGGGLPERRWSLRLEVGGSCEYFFFGSNPSFFCSFKSLQSCRHFKWFFGCCSNFFHQLVNFFVFFSRILGAFNWESSFYP